VASESGPWWVRCDGQWVTSAGVACVGEPGRWRSAHRSNRHAFTTLKAARIEAKAWKESVNVVAIMRPKRRAAVPECGVAGVDKTTAERLVCVMHPTHGGGHVDDIGRRWHGDGGTCIPHPDHTKRVMAGRRAAYGSGTRLATDVAAAPLSPVVPVDCPCNTDVDEPGPHIASCPWNDPDYVAPLPPDLRALAADPARREAYNNLRIPAAELLRWAAVPADVRSTVAVQLEFWAKFLVGDEELKRRREGCEAALALLRASGAAR
jgi:hypothetical protein